MNRFRFFLALLLTFWAAVAAAQTAPEREPIRRVIIVSVDGLMPVSYTAPDRYGLKVPTLRELVQGGAWSDGARSVLPTITYPAHTTIATGVNPGTHGIFSNVAFDPLEKNNRGWRWYAEDIRAPTLWDSARAAGMRTGLVWWPATTGASATAIVPEIWRSGTEDDLKLVRALATPGILENVAKRFPNFRAGFTPPEVKDDSVTDIAVHLIESQQPHLLMLHLPGVDHYEHTDGPFSARALEATENADRQIARLIGAAKQAGVWSETALLVVSDHGFARISQRVRPGILLAQHRLVTLDQRNRIADWRASVAAGGGFAYIYVKDPNDAATRKTLSEIFPPLAGKPGSGIRHVYTQNEIRDKGGDSAAYMALEGAEGFEVFGGYRGDYIFASTLAGTHGYDPERPEMQASFLAYGPAVSPGKIERARLLDVAPTVAAWLGLRLEKTEGTPLPIRVSAPRR